MTAPHRIDDMVFEIDFDRADQAVQSDTYLTALLRETVLPIVDELLDRHDRPGRVVTLDVLEIDLGDLPRADLAHQLAARLRAQLDDALHRLLSPATVGIFPQGAADTDAARAATSSAPGGGAPAFAAPVAAAAAIATANAAAPVGTRSPGDRSSVAVPVGATSAGARSSVAVASAAAVTAAVASAGTGEPVRSVSELQAELAEVAGFLDSGRLPWHPRCCI